MLRILVVAHDAGAAQILASLIRHQKNLDWGVAVSGPAVKIFQEAGLSVRIFKRVSGAAAVDKLLRKFNPDLVLAGTGWQSGVEVNFIRAARLKGIKTAAFLDHWVHYRERFGHPGPWKKNLPDLVFVGDVWAYKLALKAGFPAKQLRQVGNPYLEDFKKSARGHQKSENADKRSLRVLFLSDPIAECALKYHKDRLFWGFTEHEILCDLMVVADNLRNKGIDVKLKIRFHPSEKRNKYSQVLKGKEIRGRRTGPLFKDCMWADTVIGIDSMALVFALLLGRRAVSYIPGRKMVCSLPQKEIDRVSTKSQLADIIIRPLPTDAKRRSLRQYLGKTSFTKEVKRLITKR